MLGQGLVPVVAGTALGVAGALAVTRLIGTLLFGVEPTDLVTFVAVPILLIAVAAITSYVPARRATQMDPVRVLREP